MASTATASGTLIRNTQRQEAVWARNPPITGPAAPVSEAKPDHVPIALPRSSPVNVTLISASDSGTASAAPMPCTERATISTMMLGAAAHADRRQREDRDADDEEFAPAEQIAERTADQDQRREKQGVGLDHPLHLGLVAPRSR